MTHESHSQSHRGDDQFMSYRDELLQASALTNEVRGMIADRLVDNMITIAQAEECSVRLRNQSETAIDVMGRLLTYTEVNLST